MHKTVHKEYKDGPFDVKVWYSPEFVPLSDLFDDTVNNVNEMAQKVDSGNASWFIAGVDYSYEGHEFASESLGGNYYEEWEEDALDEGLGGYLEDMKATAKEEAQKNLNDFLMKVQVDFPGKIRQVSASFETVE